MPISDRLTDRAPIVIADPNYLIHIVDTADLSQDPAGSSFKMKLGDAGSAIVNSVLLTGIVPACIPPPVTQDVPSWINTLIAQICALTTAVADNTPIGVIMMWSGSIATIPLNYALCDGTGSTPDLRSKFVVGAASDGAPVPIAPYTVGSNGGLDSVLLTAGQTGVVAHNHHIAGLGGTTGLELSAHQHLVREPDNNTPVAVVLFNGQAGALGLSVVVAASPFNNGVVLSGTQTANHIHNGSNLEGDTLLNGAADANSPHENRPPYYALAYIMKIA